MAVSMAVVRHVFSLYPTSLFIQYPSTPPNKCSRMTGICNMIPASLICPAHLATLERTSRSVDMMQMIGQNGSPALHAFGENMMAVDTTIIGARTTCIKRQRLVSRFPVASTQCQLILRVATSRSSPVLLTWRYQQRQPARWCPALSWQ